MRQDIEEYYNEFSTRFVEDIAQRNERVQRQLRFFSEAIPADTSTVLVMGSGSGEAAYFIAQNVARHAHVLALDISGANLKMAESVFPHERIEYRKADVLSDSISGTWDVIILPDVYEHIPAQARNSLHVVLNELLGPSGKILITVPSPGKQADLMERGEGLQIVDEVVTLQDLVKLASDTGGLLSYFKMISVWEKNDYIHAMAERGTERIGPILVNDILPIKGLPRRSFFNRARNRLGNDLLIYKLLEFLRRRRVRKALQGSITRG